MPNVLIRLPANRYDSLPVPYTSFPRINLLTPQQSSMEDGTVAWAALLNSTPTNVATTFLDGYRCLAMTATGAGDMQVNTPALAPAFAGCPHVVQMSFLAATTPRGVAPQINWYTAGSAFISASPGVAVNDATDGWITVATTGIAPATATQASIIATALACAAGEVHYIDHIVFGSL